MFIMGFFSNERGGFEGKERGGGVSRERKSRVEREKDRAESCRPGIKGHSIQCHKSLCCVLVFPHVLNCLQPPFLKQVPGSFTESPATKWPFHDNQMI